MRKIEPEVAKGVSEQQGRQRLDESQLISCIRTCCYLLDVFIVNALVQLPVQLSKSILSVTKLRILKSSPFWQRCCSELNIWRWRKCRQSFHSVSYPLRFGQLLIQKLKKFSKSILKSFLWTENRCYSSTVYATLAARRSVTDRHSDL